MSLKLTPSFIGALAPSRANVKWSTTDQVGSWVLSQNNTNALSASGSGYAQIRADKVLSGKRYFEMKVTTMDNAADSVFGICDNSNAFGALWTYDEGVLIRGEVSGSSRAYESLGGGSGGLTEVHVTSGAEADVNVVDAILMVAIDTSAQKVWLGADGAWWNSGDPAAGTGEVYASLGASTPYTPYVATDNNAGETGMLLIGTGFNYTIPTGFTAYGA